MGEEDATARVERDLTAERDERDAFVLLLHIFSVSNADPYVELADTRLARDLAFERQHLLLLLDHLMLGGYVLCRAQGRLFITPKGIDYIERSAQNRKSVRYQARAPRAPMKWRQAQREDGEGNASV